MVFLSRLFAFAGVFGLFCTLSCTDGASGQIAASVHIPAPEKPKIDPALQAFVADYARFFADSMRLTGAPGAAVVIVKDSQVVFLKGYGLRDAGAADSIDAHTVFRVGSLSKGFAGVLAGITVQGGALRWDEPVQQRYPLFRLRDVEQARRVRLWHLLSHTSGLPYHAYTHLIEEDYPLDKIASEYFPQTRLGGREGEFYAYQNAAFSVAGEMLARASGETYAQLLREKIFLPAGMYDASSDYLSMQVRPNHALPHQWTGMGWQAAELSPGYYTNAGPAGGVNASASDMGQWLRVLLGYRPDIVADSTLEHVFQPVVRTDKERHIFPRWIGGDGAGYAMGWRVLTRGADTIVYHGGYVNGFRSEIAFNRADGIGVCILFNSNTELSKTCVPAFFARWSRHREAVLNDKKSS